MRVDFSFILYCFIKLIDQTPKERVNRKNNYCWKSYLADMRYVLAKTTMFFNCVYTTVDQMSWIYKPHLILVKLRNVIIILSFSLIAHKNSHMKAQNVEHMLYSNLQWRFNGDSAKLLLWCSTEEEKKPFRFEKT